MTANLVVVLVEPSGPLNVGSVARLCANFGVAYLRLVAPRCDPADPQAKQMAVRGLEHLLSCQLYPTLETAIADCRRVVACSGRVEGKERDHLPPQAALQWLMEPKPGPDHVAMVFGREDHGLHSSELNLAGKLLRIPTSGSYGSLNLSHAVAICLAERQRQQSIPRESDPKDSSTALPPNGAFESAMGDAENLLLEVGFLYPHTAAARMAKLRQLLLRAEPNETEVAMLRGMVRQLRWASRHGGSDEPR